MASALLVSAAVSKSGMLEAGLNRIAPYLRTTQIQIVVLVGVVTVLSAFVKNIGALAMITVAFQIARRTNTSPSSFLMPMAFGSLLGGIVTLVGTSPNIIVSACAANCSASPSACSISRRSASALRWPGSCWPSATVFCRRDARAPHPWTRPSTSRTTSPRRASPPTPDIIGQTVADLRRLANDEEGRGHHPQRDPQLEPSADATIRENDLLMLEGEPDALESAVARAGLKLSREHRQPEMDEATDEIGVIEAVIGPNSVLTGISAERIALFERFHVNLLAVSRSGQRFTERLRTINLRAGDVIVLQGNLKRLPDTLKELGCLPLAERGIRLEARAGASCPSPSWRLPWCSWRSMFCLSPSRSSERASCWSCSGP